MQAAVAGFALGFSLILAIGAQNAFVLRQGLRNSHVFAVCLTCALSDAVLIATGVAGFGALVSAAPGLETAMRIGGAGFLIWYGARTLRAAWIGGEVLEAGSGEAARLRPALLTCLALTWLNPHVYLDTVVLLGRGQRTICRPAGICAGGDDSQFRVFLQPGLWRALSGRRSFAGLPAGGCWTWWSA